MAFNIWALTQKKTLYVYTSSFSVLVLAFIIVFDLLQYTVFERADMTSQGFTESLLTIHVLSYYTALLGFVYNTKAGKRLGAAKLEWISVVATFLLSIMRVGIEISFLSFRKQAFKNFNE
ncbi:uncharacterized protein LOC121419018 [Lytechinus variegatus]|uniref:uncharacterized protein LOC121419018 n=1 Tax=Lytechinus variegatus TaxID=7654 RepID=UPI001BB229D7|nr:uncharacterized protein LOC121419018 [Lytechinus variegatus]